MRATRFCFALAVYFVVTGVWGLFSHVVLGVFTTNTIHAVIELVLAVAGLALARSAHRDSYLKGVGILLLAVGILRFVPFTGLLLATLLNLNPALAVANLVIGAAAFSVGMEERKQSP